MTQSSVVEIDGEVRTLDRIPKFHPKQLQFGTAALTIPARLNPTEKQARAIARGYQYHHSTIVLDQGAEGACTGFAAAGYLNAGPVTANPFVTSEEARALYYLNRRFDEWEGEAYEGSSVNGACLALRSLGYLQEFRWARSVEEIAEAVLLLDAMMAGTDWYEGMWRPDVNGQLHVTGRIVGGHAYLIVGVNMKKRRFIIQNSWGYGWGDRGRAWISFDDMAKLIPHFGEFAIATEVKLGKNRARIAA